MFWSEYTHSQLFCAKLKKTWCALSLFLSMHVNEYE